MVIIFALQWHVIQKFMDGWNSTHLPPSTKTKDQDLAFLKEKCDAGADFMISQFFFDVDNYIGYIKRVKEYGINIPILPGYLPIQNYRSFEKFTSWCKTAIPQEICLSLKKIKDNDEAVKAAYVELGVKTMQRLLIECKENSIGFRSLHFYTMNLAVAVTQILQIRDAAKIPNANYPIWNEMRRKM